MKTTIAVIAILGACSAAHAADWATDPNGCRIWNSWDVSTLVWHGACPDGYAEGPGVLEQYYQGKLSSRFEGNLVRGKKAGHGVMTYSDGERYEGMYVDDMRQGRGVYTWPTGDRYEGDYVANRRTGRGVYTWGSGTKWAGDRYEGEYVDGKKEGRGVYVSASGRRYEGEFRDDEETGNGIVTYPPDTTAQQDSTDDPLATIVGVLGGAARGSAARVQRQAVPPSPPRPTNPQASQAEANVNTAQGNFIHAEPVNHCIKFQKLSSNVMGVHNVCDFEVNFAICEIGRCNANYSGPTNSTIKPGFHRHIGSGAFYWHGGQLKHYACRHTTNNYHHYFATPTSWEANDFKAVCRAYK